MTLWMTRIAPLALGLVCVPAGLAAALPEGRSSAGKVLADAPPELASRLEAERVVVLEDVSTGGPDSFIVAYVLFRQGRGRVATLLRDTERQMEYRPELREVRTVAMLPNGRIDEQKLKIAFRTLTYRLRYREDPETGRLTWGLDPDFDNDLALLEGFWELYAFDGQPDRTLGRFGSRTDVGRSVPKFIQKGMSRKTVLRYIRNCREWTDSNGEWRP